MDNVEERARQILDTAFKVFMLEQEGDPPKEVGTAISGIVSFLKVGLTREMDDPEVARPPWECKDCG